MTKKDSINMDFIEDRYFEKGNGKLRLQENATIISLWLVLIYPILVAINSFPRKPFWSFIFHWDLQQGREFTHLVLFVLTTGFSIVTVLSLIFMTYNNYREEYVFSKKKLYNETHAKNRAQTLDEIYAQRFGAQEFRENIQFYTIAPEQNLPNTLVQDTFKEKGV